MTEPLISVVLPVYNGGKTLALALDSVLWQTLPDFELIVLDDGSSDDSREVAARFDDARIKLVNDGRRMGLAARLNHGLDLARGRYIARMDQDDICFPERFKRQFETLESHPEIDLLGCRAVVFRDGGQTVGLMPFAPDHESLCRRPWRGIPLPHPSWMGRREWFLRHRYRSPEVVRAEDQELLLRSYPQSRFACLDEVLLGYRQGPFKLGRTLLARDHLLRAQLRLFGLRREWGNAALAIGITALKILVDGLAALPGAEGLFFRRMAEPVPLGVAEELQRYLDDGQRLAR